MTFPTRTFPRLWHVGSMKRSAKSRNSFEGAGLSVSLHPAAWAMIAKLGRTCWQLERENNRFLDALKLGARKREAIRDWGLSQNMVIPATLYRLDYLDQDENGEDVKRWSVFHTRRKAEEEAEEYEQASVTEFQGVVGGAKLARITRCEMDVNLVEDLLMTVYADQVLDLDGVWWNETYDPDNLSAPRGVILPRKLDAWNKVKVPLSDFEDDY